MINRVIMTGRLTDAPDLRYTPNGVAVANLTLAVDRKFSNQQGKRETDFFDFIAWRQKAETIANYVVKGQKVSIDAFAQTRYRDIEGRRVKVVEFVVEEIEFGEKPRGKGNSNQTQEQGQQPSSSPQQSRSNQQPYKQEKDPFEGHGTPIDIGDDELPF